jgi:tRNA pseudouridine32 synthase/23S rRNA pseudouridine746 synthase
MQAPYIVPPCSREVDILYEDSHLLLVNKPQLLLSVPGRHPLNQDCLINRLRRHWPTASIVHRLDLDTSGVMVVPLNADCHRQIGHQFERRAVHKEYEAVVYGHVQDDRGEINLPIAPDWQRRPRQKICHQRGKAALTRYEVLAREALPRRTRLRLVPETGRSHQLRLHLSCLGHPILGCDLYAHATALALSARLQLHATRLQLTHPVTGQTVAAESSPEF